MSGFGANPTTTTQSSLATNQFPTPSVAVPGTANGDLTALEGGPASTDANGNKTAPVSMYVKDGGDIVQGTTTDAANANTVLGQLKQIKTNTTSQTVTANAGSGNFTVIQTTGSNLHAVIDSGTITANHQQADLTTSGTVSAAQPSINTPVSNATISLAVGTGQSTWKAQLLAGGGGFTSGTTIVADKSPDGGTTWYSASFKVAGAATNTPVTSIVGPGPIELTGNAAGVSHVRIRCSVINSAETIAVTLRGGVGVGDIGLLSPIPAGTNLMGGINLVDSGGTNKATISAGGAVKTDASATTQPISGTVTTNQGGTWTVQPGNTANTTAWKVDGSAVTQPVSGTVTANAGTNMSTASLALETGGNLATLAGGVTSSKYQANHAQVSGTAVSVNAGNRDAGTQRFIEAGNGTSTVTQVASSASDVSLLAANANKKGTLFYNDSTATLYLLYGTGTATTTNYSVQIPPKTLFEDPFHTTSGFHGIWSSANGYVYCTEVS